MITRLSESSLANNQLKSNSALNKTARSMVVWATPGSGQGVLGYTNVETLNFQTSLFGIVPYLKSSSGSSACYGSTTRGVQAGGNDYTGVSSSMVYITFATFANAQNFGTMYESATRAACNSSTIYGYRSGGDGPSSVRATVEYVTIATTGNGTLFGGMNDQRSYMIGGGQSSTRGVVAGGWTGARRNNINYITFGTSGTSVNFGYLVTARYAPSLTASQYLAYDVTIAPNDTITFTLGITLGATDVVTIYASSATMSFSLYGSEITA